jgi:hypothetical protein
VHWTPRSSRGATREGAWRAAGCVGLCGGGEGSCACRCGRWGCGLTSRSGRHADPCFVGANRLFVLSECLVVCAYLLYISPTGGPVLLWGHQAPPGFKGGMAGATSTGAGRLRGPLVLPQAGAKYSPCP